MTCVDLWLCNQPRQVHQCDCYIFRQQECLDSSIYWAVLESLQYVCVPAFLSLSCPDQSPCAWPGKQGSWIFITSLPHFINLYHHLKCPIDILNSVVPVLKARCLLGGENLKMAFHIIIEILYYLRLSYYLRNSLHHTYRVLFLTVPPDFQYQNEKTCSANEELFYIENFLKK